MNLGSLFGGGDFKVPQSSSMTHLGVKERPRFRSTVTMHNEKSLPNNSQQQQQQQHRKRRKKKRRVRNKREGHSKRSDEDDDNDEEDDEEDEERGKVDDEISEEEDKRRFHQRQLSQLTSYNQKRRRRRQRSADLAGQFSTGIVEPGGVKNSSFSSSSSSGRGSAGSSSLVAVNVVPDIVITRDDEDYQDSAIHSGIDNWSSLRNQFDDQQYFYSYLKKTRAFKIFLLCDRRHHDRNEYDSQFASFLEYVFSRFEHADGESERNVRRPERHEAAGAHDGGGRRDDEDERTKIRRRSG